MNYTEFYKKLAKRYHYEPRMGYETLFFAHRLNMAGLEYYRLESVFDLAKKKFKQMPTAPEILICAIKLGYYIDPNTTWLEEEIDHDLLHGD